MREVSDYMLVVSAYGMPESSAAQVVSALRSVSPRRMTESRLPNEDGSSHEFSVQPLSWDEADALGDEVMSLAEQFDLDVEAEIAPLNRPLNPQVVRIFDEGERTLVVTSEGIVLADDEHGWPLFGRHHDAEAFVGALASERFEVKPEGYWAQDDQSKRRRALREARSLLDQAKA